MSNLYEHIKERAGLKVEDTTSWGDIKPYEILNFLGLIDPEDKSNYSKIRTHTYERIINPQHEIRDLKFINDFLESSVPIEFTEEQKKEIKNAYFNKQISQIQYVGFNTKIGTQLSLYEKHFGEMESDKKRELYIHAMSSLEKELNSSYQDDFISHFKDIFEYFDKVPRHPKDLLKKYITDLLKEKYLSSDEVDNLHSAEELFRQIDGHNKDREGKYYTGKIKRKVNVQEKMAEHIGILLEDATNQFRNHTEFEKLAKLYGLMFDKDELKSGLEQIITDSISQPDKYDDSEHHFSWRDIMTKMNKLQEVYDILELTGNQTEKATDFETSVRKRILSEAESGEIKGLRFWDELIGEDKDIRDKFNNNFRTWYESIDKKEKICTFSGSKFRRIARDYKLVLGDYPKEFYEDYQDILVNLLDELMSDNDMDPHEKKNKISYLGGNIGQICRQSELHLLPKLHEKIVRFSEESDEIEEHPDITKTLMYRVGQSAGYIPYYDD